MQTSADSNLNADKEKIILKTFDYEIKVNKDSPDTIAYLKGDTIINKQSGEK